MEGDRIEVGGNKFLTYGQKGSNSRRGEAWENQEKKGSVGHTSYGDADLSRERSRSGEGDSAACFRGGWESTGDVG